MIALPPLVDLTLERVDGTAFGVREAMDRQGVVLLPSLRCTDIATEISSSEVVFETPNPKIHAVHGAPFDWHHVESQLNLLHSSLAADSDAALRARLKEIVPEYMYQPALHPRRVLPNEKMAPQSFRRSASGR